MNTRINKFIYILLIVLLVEKIFQHAVTSASFLFTIPGLGTHDIGTRFDISNPVMGLSNAVLAVLFACALWGISSERPWSRNLIFVLAGFDIVAEFILHGFFFITISVLVAAILIILLLIFPVGNKSTDVAL